MPDPNATAGQMADAVSRIEFAYGHTTALTTAYASIELGAHASEGDAEAVPSEGFLLSHIAVHLDTIVTASSITAFLAWDTTRDLGASNEVLGLIVVGATAGKGSTVIDFAAPGAPLRAPASAADATKLYLHLKTDAGTANAKAYAYYRPARGDR